VRAPSTAGWFTFAVRVNGVEFHRTFLRSCGEHPTNFEVVIRDPELGSFALHDEFLLEVLEGEEDNTRWRQISFAELKVAVLEEAQKAACDPCQGPSTPESHWEASKSPVRGIIGRIPVEGDSSHVGRADEALTRAGIRFQIVGGLDSRGRCACHVTLVVCSLVGAGTCLRRAGFLESSESKYVLVDSRTGWELRLLEGRPRPSPAH
jgi:hypothetical protein